MYKCTKLLAADKYQYYHYNIKIWLLTDGLMDLPSLFGAAYKQMIGIVGLEFGDKLYFIVFIGVDSSNYIKINRAEDLTRAGKLQLVFSLPPHLSLSLSLSRLYQSF